MKDTSNFLQCNIIGQKWDYVLKCECQQFHNIDQELSTVCTGYYHENLGKNSFSSEKEGKCGCRTKM